jgi:DNA-binding transcriptional MerR regulator
MGDARGLQQPPPSDGSRSIGEILDDLRGDFPDISVSKIRFLESQGLITPERSPSGYRQFTEADLELLRWILRQQRDHYLPLKVIRRRLKDGDGPGPAVEVSSPAAAGPTAPTPTAPTPPTVPGAPGTRAAAASLAVDQARLTLPDPAPAAPPDEDAVWLVPDGGPDPATSPPTPAGALSPAPAVADELWPAGGEARYSRNDIRQETGLDERSMGELESFGLLPAAGPEGYGPETLRIAEIAAAFFGYGVEARHLRMYKTFAEREAAFLGQVVMPKVSPKDPGSAARATDALTELARLGAALRLSMLRVSIGPPPRGMGGVPPTEAAGAAKDRA